jgi:hypothetical protein
VATIRAMVSSKLHIAYPPSNPLRPPSLDAPFTRVSRRIDDAPGIMHALLGSQMKPSSECPHPNLVLAGVV